MKNTVVSFLLLITLSSCSSSKNWQGTQSGDKWQATFDGFNGKEHLSFAKEPNRLVYLRTQFDCMPGTLSLKNNGKILPAGLTVAHKKISLDRK